MTDIEPRASSADWAGCSFHNRRDFLLDALSAAAAAIAAIGMTPSGADEIPLQWISSIAAKG